MKNTFIIAFVVFVILSLSSCFGGKDTIIKTGFSEERVKMLKEDYMLNITSQAVFISGYYDNEFRDPALWIFFEVPEEQFDSLFIENWYVLGQSGYPNNEYLGVYQYLENGYDRFESSSENYSGSQSISSVENDHQPRSALIYYSRPVNGFIMIKFIGLRAGSAKE